MAPLTPPQVCRRRHRIPERIFSFQDHDREFLRSTLLKSTPDKRACCSALEIVRLVLIGFWFVLGLKTGWSIERGERKPVREKSPVTLNSPAPTAGQRVQPR
jgi:hypothetical protein